MPEELLEGQRFNPYGKFYNAWVPTQLLQAVDISPGAKLLYGLLRKYAGADGNCFPKQTRLAREMSCTRRSIQYYLTELKDAKLIHVAAPTGTRRSCRYEFLWKKELISGQKCLGDEQPANTTCEENFTPASLYEEVPLSGSPNINSSSRACGNVENFGGFPESEATAENQTCEGNSEQGENRGEIGGKLARNGWKVLQLGNQSARDTDVVAGSLLRKQISELAELKRMKR